MLKSRLKPIGFLTILSALICHLYINYAVAGNQWDWEVQKLSPHPDTFLFSFYLTAAIFIALCLTIYSEKSFKKEVITLFLSLFIGFCIQLFVFNAMLFDTNGRRAQVGIGFSHWTTNREAELRDMDFTYLMLFPMIAVGYFILIGIQNFLAQLGEE